MKKIEITIKRGQNEDVKQALIGFCEKTDAAKIGVYTPNSAASSNTDYLRRMLQEELEETAAANAALNGLMSELQEKGVEYSVKTTSTERILTVEI